MYIRARSAANSADSSPPSPDFTSSTMSSASCGSRGASRSVRCSSSSATLASSSGTSAANAESSAASSRAASRSPRAGSELAVGRRRSAPVGRSGAPPGGHWRCRRAVRDRTADARGRRVRRARRRSPLRRCCVIHPPLRPVPKRRPTPGLSLEIRDRSGVGEAAIVSAELAGLALAVPLLEAGHAAAAVEDLLLARVERVALRADLDHDVAAVLGAAGGEAVATAADHGGLGVGRMNA